MPQIRVLAQTKEFKFASSTSNPLRSLIPVNYYCNKPCSERQLASAQAAKSLKNVLAFIRICSILWLQCTLGGLHSRLECGRFHDSSKGQHLIPFSPFRVAHQRFVLCYRPQALRVLFCASLPSGDSPKDHFFYPRATLQVNLGFNISCLAWVCGACISSR